MIFPILRFWTFTPWRWLAAIIMGSSDASRSKCPRSRPIPIIPVELQRDFARPLPIRPLHVRPDYTVAGKENYMTTKPDPKGLLACPLGRLAEHLSARPMPSNDVAAVADWLDYSLNKSGTLVVDEQSLARPSPEPIDLCPYAEEIPPGPERDAAMAVDEVEQIVSAWAFAHDIDGAARNDLFKRLRTVLEATGYHDLVRERDGLREKLLDRIRDDNQCDKVICAEPNNGNCVCQCEYIAALSGLGELRGA